jgi:hypothetical protein
LTAANPQDAGETAAQHVEREVAVGGRLERVRAFPGAGGLGECFEPALVLDAFQGGGRRLAERHAGRRANGALTNANAHGDTGRHHRRRLSPETPRNRVLSGTGSLAAARTPEIERI